MPSLLCSRQAMPLRLSARPQERERCLRPSRRHKENGGAPPGVSAACSSTVNSAEAGCSTVTPRRLANDSGSSLGSRSATGSRATIRNRSACPNVSTAPTPSAGMSASAHSSRARADVKPNSSARAMRLTPSAASDEGMSDAEPTRRRVPNRPGYGARM